MPKPTVTLALLAAVLLAAGCATTGTTSATYQVRYEVTGTAAAADLTLEGEDGTVQQNDRPVPAAYTRTATDGQFLYLSAQNKGGGEITCTIYVNGQPVKSSTSSGEFAICQADGSL